MDSYKNEVRTSIVFPDDFLKNILPVLLLVKNNVP